MVQKKNAKTITLVVSAVVIISSFVYVPDWSVIGVSEGCSLLARFGYSFFHTSPVHAFVNVWCLLCIVFLYDISVWRLLGAYIAAITVPEFLLSEIPTVGLSCVCYTLLGSLSFCVKRKLYFQLCIIAYIAIGFLFPSVNSAIHVYGYLTGIFAGTVLFFIRCARK